jgi:hypothetical protein
MVTIKNNLESLKKSVNKYNLRVKERWNDGAFRVYLLARKGTGIRGGYRRNIRLVYLLPEEDNFAWFNGILKKDIDYKERIDYK